MNCEPIKPKRYRVCIGDLSKKIEIETRDIQTPTTGVDFDEQFNSFKTMYAMVETASKGEVIFDESNIEQTVTHNFYVRYMPNLTFQNWIKYNGVYFNIQEVENLNEENRFLRIKASIRGTATLDVNKV